MPYRYTSKELDEETGLYYYGARYYDPRTSVWQSPDPILAKYLPDGDASRKGSDLPGSGVFNPKNLAMFAYSYQSPVVLSDLDGNRPLTYNEIALAMDYFGAGIDYNDVDIEPAENTMISDPHTIGNTIYVPKWMYNGNKKADDLAAANVWKKNKAKFLHEMEHIHQNQRGELFELKAGLSHAVGWVLGVIKAVFTAPFSNKTFGQIVDDTRINFVYHDGWGSEPTKSFDQYSVEERGQIVEDKARADFGLTVTKEVQKAKDILKADPDALER